MSRVTADNRTSDGVEDGAPHNGGPRAENLPGAPAQADKSDPEKPKTPPLYKRLAFWIVAAIILIGGGTGGLIWWLNARYKVSTDDAFISAHNTTVSPRVSGHVVRVLVDDNQDVKKGDLLVVLDDKDFIQALKSVQASLEMTQAQLAQANANLASAKASVAQAQADVSSAQASASQAESDRERYHSVQKSDPRAVSQQQVDQADANARTTAAQLEASKEKEGAAKAQVVVAAAQIIAAQAAIDKARSDVDNAGLQLSYTKILAAEDGQVTIRSVEVGNYITPGQALMALVPRNVWVTGNFKETQLRTMRVGQPVKVHVDAYDIDLAGHVQSIQAGSGAAFSLLPPENATGNYVKVVQRVPVKITFDQLPPPAVAGDVGGIDGGYEAMTAAAPSSEFPRPVPLDYAQKAAVNPWTVAVVVSIATFMEVLDTSIANVAIPHIAGGTASTANEATWVLTSYLVANAVVLPASGWLSTVIGRKRFYMACVALFTISSFMCGIAPNLEMLIVCRVLQGIGGGGLAPSEQAILADTFEPKKRGMAFALYGIVVVCAPAIGPTLGGWITDNFSWRWIFFINVPVGVLSLFLSHLVVSDPPELTAERHRRLRAGLKIDYIGFGLLALGLGCLQVVLDKGQEDDWFGSSFICCMAIVAALGVVLGVIWELSVEQPVLDVQLLRDRTFAISVIVMFAIGIVLFGTTVMLPLFSQEMLGYTAELAGLAITPGGFFVMALMPMVGFLINHMAARYMVMIGLAISSLSIYHMTSFDLNVSFSTLMWARIYQASGLAFLFIPINTAAYAGLPRAKSNDASAMMNLARNLGGSVGISLASTLLTRRSQYHQSVLASHVTPFNPLVNRTMQGMSGLYSSHGGSSPAYAMLQGRQMIYDLVQQQAKMLAYIDVFWVLSVGCALMIPLLFLLRKNKPGGGPMGH